MLSSEKSRICSDLWVSPGLAQPDSQIDNLALDLAVLQKAA